MENRDHYYPQMLLESWCIKGTKSIWVYDKYPPKNPHVKQIHKKRKREIFMKRGLYVVNGKDDIDNHLKIGEGEFKDILDRIYTNTVIEEDLGSIKLFFNYLLNRNKFLFEEEAAMKEFELEHQGIHSDNPGANTIIERVKYSKEFFNSCGVMILCIPRTEQNSFILSDSALFRMEGYLFCPFGKKHMVRLTPPSVKINNLYQDIPGELVTEFNKISYGVAREYFIADRVYLNVEELVR